MKEKIEFMSEGSKVVGNLFKPGNYTDDGKYKAIIVSGSWTTVKEQMSGDYARRLAANGFLTLAFDFRGFGESEGEPRFFESPGMKIRDINNAVEYFKSRNDVQSIGLLGICAGAAYSLTAASENENVKAVVAIASWIHDEEAVKLLYGGKEGVQSRLDDAKAAKEKFAKTGDTDYVESISVDDEKAAMFGAYDYYFNPNRGAIKEWSADKFEVMSWEDWLTYNPRPSAKKLEASTLMIHSDGAILPDYIKKYFDDIKTFDKKLVWVDTDLDSPMHQFSFYDEDKEVSLSVKNATEWFDHKLK